MVAGFDGSVRQVPAAHPGGATAVETRIAKLKGLDNPLSFWGRLSQNHGVDGRGRRYVSGAIRVGLLPWTSFVLVSCPESRHHATGVIIALRYRRQLEDGSLRRSRR